MRLKGKKKFWVPPIAPYYAAAGGTPFSLTYQSSAGSADTTHTTVDYGTLTYGSGNTRVIVAVQWFPSGGAGTITGVTIGGVALAQISGARIDTGGGQIVDMWQSTGPLAGTSGDVQVTYSSTIAFVSIVGLYNLQTNTPAASSTATGSSTFATSISTSSPVVVPAGGGALVALMTGNTSAFSFTNATFDASVLQSGETDAHFGHATGSGSISPGGTWTGATGAAVSVVAWGP